MPQTGSPRRTYQRVAATRDTVCGERIGEAIGGLTQPAVGNVLVRAIRAHVEDREPIGVVRGPLVADVDADVVMRKLRPAEFAIQCVIVVDGRKHEKSRLAWRN